MAVLVSSTSIGTIRTRWAVMASCTRRLRLKIIVGVRRALVRLGYALLAPMTLRAHPGDAIILDAIESRLTFRALGG